MNPMPAPTRTLISPSLVARMPSSCTLVLLLAAALWLSGCSSSHLAAPVQEQGVSSPAPTTVTSQPDGPGYYTVRRGDTLNAIARQYGQTVANLATWNNLNNVNQIEVGQVLRVSPPDATPGRPDSGVEVRPIAAPGSEPRPVSPGTATVVATPKGGKQPYAEQPAAESAPAKLPEPAPTPEPAASSSIKWIWPGSGKMVAPFSEGGNKGIDLAGNLGDPVIAASGGKVVYAGSGLRGYGKLVIIKHDNEFLSAYAHNRELLVKEGDSVNAGQKIAELGNTDADRPKLHFEIRKQGKPVDPLKYLPSR